MGELEEDSIADFFKEMEEWKLGRVRLMINNKDVFHEDPID